MKKMTKTQMLVICNSWQFKLTFFIVTAFVLVNHVWNVKTYIGLDYYQLHDGVKLMLLSNFSGAGFYFMQIFPILVILPAGFSFVMDQKNNSQVFMIARCGIKNYYKSKSIAIFCTSFLVFTIPLALEILLSMIAFPVSVTADPGNVGLFELTYINMVKMYPLSDLFVANRWLYMTIYIILLGITAGVFNIFIAALSVCFHRFPVLLFLPIYLILYLLYFMNMIFPEWSISTYYFFYLQAFSGVRVSYVLYLLFLAVLAIVSYVIFYTKTKSAEIQ